YIFLAGILFFLLFYFFLRFGEKVTQKVEQIKIINWIILFISIIFCASMFAGIKNLFAYFPNWLYITLLVALLVLTFCLTVKGIGGLEKLNMILMPIASVVFFGVLIYGATMSSGYKVETTPFAGLLYSPLYVALNTSISGLLIAKVGKGLSKKQTFLSSLFSTIIILIFLFLGNFVLRQNPLVYASEMPFLSLMSSNKVMFVLIYLVLFAGCFTTLMSLCITLKISFEKFVSDQKFSSVLSVFVPCILSSIGFSQIVSLFYPIASVLGIFILLFVIFSFKQTDKEIHSECQDAQDRCRRHD
ncbi:MAG: hypothetical protein K2K31_02635, partial [Clostridia bacterium]|nr:hypothetical protein [Clostridia bacterium]